MFPHTGHSKPLQLEQRYPPAPIACDDRPSATSLLHFTQRTVFAFLLHPEHLKLIACDGRSSTTSLLHSTHIFVRAFLTHSAHLNALVVLVAPARDGLFIGTSLLHSKHTADERDAGLLRFHRRPSTTRCATAAVSLIRGSPTVVISPVSHCGLLASRAGSYLLGAQNLRAERRPSSSTTSATSTSIPVRAERRVRVRRRKGRRAATSHTAARLGAGRSSWTIR
jgi:hypothetical protein